MQSIDRARVVQGLAPVNHHRWRLGNLGDETCVGDVPSGQLRWLALRGPVP